MKPIPKFPSNSKGVKAFNIRFGWNFKISSSRGFQLYSSFIPAILIFHENNNDLMSNKFG